MFPLAVRPDSGESRAQEWLARTVAWYGVTPSVIELPERGKILFGFVDNTFLPDVVTVTDATGRSAKVPSDMVFSFFF